MKEKPPSFRKLEREVLAIISQARYNRKNKLTKLLEKFKEKIKWTL